MRGDEMNGVRRDLDDGEPSRELAAAAGDWLRDAAPAAGGHPSVDELIAYQGGRLDGDAERRVQDHLVVCRDCLDHLDELAGFVAEKGGAGETAPAADLATAAAWRALRPRLVAAPPRRLPRWAQAAAAALLVAAVGLGLWGLDRQAEVRALGERLAELSQPRPGAAIVDLYPASAARGQGAPPAPAELPADGFVTLVVNLPPDAPPGPYRLEIADAVGDRLWSGGGFEASRLGTLRLGLPEAYLPPGVHTLRLAAAGEEESWIETYPLRVGAP